MAWHEQIGLRRNPTTDPVGIVVIAAVLYFGYQIAFNGDKPGTLGYKLATGNPSAPGPQRSSGPVVFQYDSGNGLGTVGGQTDSSRYAAYAASGASY